MKYNIIILSLLLFGCLRPVKDIVAQNSETELQDTIKIKPVTIDSLDSIPPVINPVKFYEGSFQSALKLAKKENKKIFIFYTASWCSPCHRMEKETFTQEAVYKRLNNDFIPFKADEEEFDGYELIQKYKVVGFPTLIIINPKGKVLYRTSGFKFWTRLIEEIKSY